MEEITATPELNIQAPVAVAAPNVLNYMDYREFLRDWLQWKKNTSPHYSGTLFATKAGISSHNLLGMVIRGERNLGLSTIHGFIKACSLKSHSALYFERLVVYCQSKDSIERAEIFEQLVQLGKKRGVENLKSLQNYSQYLTGWHVVAIRELVHLKDFQNDPEWISIKLKRKISRRQAEAAMETLKTLGLIEWDSLLNRYVNKEANLDIDVSKVDFRIRNFHRNYMERAQESIDGEAIGERSLSSLTIAVSAADLQRLRERINEFRKQLNVEFSDSQNDKDHVVAVNTQFLILTESNTPESKKKGAKSNDV
ncbi:MAG: TIGR02147 family protein [Bdellovibrionales bacterium]